MPALIVGLTIVSFGTSLPELLVTMIAGFRGDADLAIGNVIGSNIANVLAVLGVAAIIRPLPVRDSTVVSEIPFSLTAVLLVGFLANAALFSDYRELSISRLDGCILLFFFLLFMIYVYKVARESTDAGEASEPEYSLLRSVTYIVVGIAGLYLGGEAVVGGAVGLASRLGVDDALIGLTIVAAGTSAPELIASAVAAYRGQTDIAVGNVIGSNIFNLLFILGVTSSFVELPFKALSNSDLVMVMISSSLVLLALISSRRKAILRVHGVIFVGLYIAYICYVIVR